MLSLKRYEVVLYLPQTRRVSELNVSQHIVRIDIEKLPEGVYLAISDHIRGVVAQGRTIAETVERAPDGASHLLEAQENIQLPPVSVSFDYPLIVEG
jgi:predicted RNase H-like HicB family nuclease